MRDRPAATYETGAVTRSLRVTAVVVCAAGVSWALTAWPSLPDTIPTRIDIAGATEDSGPRWTLLVLLGAWVAIQGLLTWLSLHPRLFNYPVPLADSNAQRLYREGERTMVWISLGVCVVFAGVAATAFGVAAVPVIAFGMVGLVASTIAGTIRVSLTDTP